MMLLDDKTKMRMAAVLVTVKCEAAKAPFMLAGCGIATALLLLSVGIEYEVLYRPYEYLAGEDNQYWSPSLMALSGLSMIAGFHFLAKDNPNNLAFVFISRAALFLIPVYLIGIGLVISSMVIGSGWGDLFGGNPIIFDVEAAKEAAKGNWFENLYIGITHPLAKVAFGVGVGGISIVNLYVAHKLISFITEQFMEGFMRKNKLKEIKHDYELAITGEQRYIEVGFDQADLESMDDLTIAEEKANDVLLVIGEGLAPHEEYFNEFKLAGDPGQFPACRPDDDVDLKQLEKCITKIKAVDMAMIVKAMLPNHSLEKK